MQQAKVEGLKHGPGQIFYHVSDQAQHVDHTSIYHISWIASGNFVRSHSSNRPLQQAKVDAPKHGAGEASYHVGCGEGGLTCSRLVSLP